MTPSEILTYAGPSWASRTLECHASLPSTNDRAIELLAARGPRAHLAAVFAEDQTEGRGRQGRPWHTAAGLSVTCTVVAALGVPAETSGLLPLAASLAVASALRQSAGVETSLRWPNDVDVAGRKIAGVLVEGRWQGSEPEGFAVGMGANLLQNRADFPPEIRGLATSVLAETGRTCSRPAYAGALLDAIEDRLGKLRSDPGALLREASPIWAHEAGARLEVLTAEGSICGVFSGVGSLGELLLETAGGRRALVQGEVLRLGSSPTQGVRPRAVRGGAQ